jgi:hypothetical protein
MMQTLSPPRPVGSILRVGVGVEAGPDALMAVLGAATAARADLAGVTPHLAVVVTTTAPHGDLVSAIRGVLGPVGVTGGVAAALLTEGGIVTEGALVLCVSNAEGAASGVACTSGRTLGDAAQAAARLVLAGWPFRGRYPRGIGLAFARQDSGRAAGGFLTPWRDLVGPKMRTVCGVMSAPSVFGGASTSGLASVGCLEAPYLMGLGLADGSATGAPDADVLIHGSVDATRTALKWLEGHPARVVLALESAARYRALGGAAAREWAAIREQVRDYGQSPAIGSHAGGPCVGWICEDVAAYGRGVHPVDVPGALVVAALGDAARDHDRLG